MRREALRRPKPSHAGSEGRSFAAPSRAFASVTDSIAPTERLRPPSVIGHDYSRIRAKASDQPAKGISASGAIDIDYKPDATDKGSKIVFIQVMRELLDGAPRKPSVLDKDFAYEDKDTTGAFHHVDYFDGEKDPYYNGDDAKDSGTKGDATAKPPVDATMNDGPSYVEGTLPAGSTKVRYEFRTAAFSAAGGDAGSYYAYQDWTYDFTKGAGDKTASGSSGTGSPGTTFTDAVSLWNSNHGFKMPASAPAAAPTTPPSPAPAPAPSPSPKP